MRILLVSRSPSMQWIIGRTLNDAGVGRTSSEYVVANCSSLEQVNLQRLPALVLIAIDSPLHDAALANRLYQICDRTRVWIVYEGPRQAFEKNLANCPAPLICLDQFDTEFVTQNLKSCVPTVGCDV